MHFKSEGTEITELYQMFSWKNSASLLVVLLALTLASSAEKDINIVLADSRVLVEIYAESLCPYC